MKNKDIQDYFFCMDKEVKEKDPKSTGEKLLQRPVKYKLTKKMIEEAYPNSIIFSGYGVITHPWFNDTKENLLSDGKSTLVKYVVARGTVADWCIYHSLDANLCSNDYLDGWDHLKAYFMSVHNSGAKIHDKKEALRLVEFGDDVWSLYRH